MISLIILFFCSVVFDDNACDLDPCVHGNCTDLVLDYRCECFPGYGDKNCSSKSTFILKMLIHFAWNAIKSRTLSQSFLQKNAPEEGNHLFFKFTTTDVCISILQLQIHALVHCVEVTTSVSTTTGLIGVGALNHGLGAVAQIVSLVSLMLISE